MADYTAMPLPAQTVAFAEQRYAPAAATVLTGGGTPTTYYYRTIAGVRASTTSISSVPAGAVIERIV
jgi:hypothetical protein